MSQPVQQFDEELAREFLRDLMEHVLGLEDYQRPAF